MSIKKTVSGYVMLALGLGVAAVGLHASSDRPDTPSHLQKGRAESAFVTVASLGAGAGLAVAGYRLLSAAPAARGGVRVRARSDDEA